MGLDIVHKHALPHGENHTQHKHVTSSNILPWEVNVGTASYALDPNRASDVRQRVDQCGRGNGTSG